MMGRGIAILGMMLLCVGCAARTPRLPEPGDRVRLWTAPEVSGDDPIAAIGEVERISIDTLTLRPEDAPLRSLAWSAIEALEIDAARGRTGWRVFACAALPLGVTATAMDLVGDERNTPRAVVNGLNSLLFLDACLFPGPDWRTARIAPRP